MAIPGKKKSRAGRSLTAKGAATRAEILETAHEVFKEGGYYGSSISEITRRCGVSMAAFYQYFRNKEDLFFSIPIEKTKEFRSQVELHLEGISGTFNKIRKFVWYFLYFFKTNPDYGRILMLEMRVSRSFVKTKTYDFLKQSVGVVMDIIAEGQKEGVIRLDTDVYILRHLILGTLEHMVTRWLLKDTKYDLLEHHKQVSRVLISGLEAKPLAKGK